MIVSSFHKKEAAAKLQFGEATTRPQDQHINFLKFLRRLNSAKGWMGWPVATEEIKNRIKTSHLGPLEEKQEFNDVSYVPFTIVEDKNSFDEMMEDVRIQDVIALDFEFHKQHSYNGLIALIQLSTECFNYIIDPFTLRDEILKEFNPSVIENPKLLKVMCGCSNDVLMTQSNFLSFLTSVVDIQDIYDAWKAEDPHTCFALVKPAFKRHILERQTQTSKNRRHVHVSEDDILREWEKEEPISYKKLMESLFRHHDITIPKTAQVADFRVRPLGELAEYAARDVHFLYAAFWMLKSKVSEKGLNRAFELSKKKLKKTFALQKYPSAATLLAKKVSITKPRSVAIFVKLHSWRDELGRTMDEAPDHIMLVKEMETISNSQVLPMTMPVLQQILISNKCRYVPLQFNRLLAIINDDEQILNHIASMRCNNCYGLGHQGWDCVFPKSAGTLKFWMELPENYEFKVKQNYRRAVNWYHKNGKWPSQAPLAWYHAMINEQNN